MIVGVVHDMTLPFHEGKNLKSHNDVILFVLRISDSFFKIKVINKNKYIYLLAKVHV